MSSSLSSESPFEGVAWPHVLTLLDLVSNSTIRNEAYIERRYREQATNFGATIEFLIAIEMLSRGDGILSMHVNLPLDSNSRRDAILGHTVLSGTTPHATELLEYVGGYRLKIDEIECPADLTSTCRYSAVRNFLMEMGLVRYRESDRTYTLGSSHGWLVALARAKSRSMAPAQLATKLGMQDDLGWRVERAVVERERERLGQIRAHFVEHTAEKNVLAGYDILSATVTGDEILPRFIEVKAVPRESLQFYWTQNEVEVAKVVGPLYYLYLIPVKTGGIPDVDAVTIVPNPCSRVLCDDNWQVKVDVLQCQLRRMNSIEDP